MIQRSTIRGGFSLAELLVVIGIMLLLLALSAGAFLRTTRINKVLATEHLIADMLRQARHTARNTGTPVMIEILAPDPDKAGTIAGVSQVPVWNYAFEATKPPSNHPDDTSLPSTWLIEAGLTGKALRLLQAPNAGDPEVPPPYHLDRNQRLKRGARDSGGFYISCRVRPPVAANFAWSPDQPAPAAEEWVPLIIIGDSADVTTCSVGLALHRYQKSVQPEMPKKVDPTTFFRPQLSCWQIVGWINGGRDDANYNNQVRSILDDIQQFTTPPSTTFADDPNGPIAGGTWIDVGMLYDGRQLALFRDGSMVARMETNSTTSRILATSLTDSKEFIYIAQQVDPTLTYPLQFRLDTDLDDVRIFRLGTDQPAALPGGMRPQTDYHILVHPDGRTRSANNLDIIYTFVNANDSNESAVITITSDGTVKNSETKLDVRP